MVTLECLLFAAQLVICVSVPAVLQISKTCKKKSIPQIGTAFAFFLQQTFPNSRFLKISPKLLKQMREILQCNDRPQHASNVIIFFYSAGNRN